MKTAITPTLKSEAPAAASEVALPPKPRVVISARFLLGIYAIVPICLLAMLFDIGFWNKSLFQALPTSPDSFFFFQIVFGTPHIIASAVILATNGAYLRTYWLRLLLFSLFLLLFFGVGNLYFRIEVFYAVVGAATVLHVIKQQVGIGKGLCRVNSWVYEAWGYTMVAFGSILYYAIYVGFSAESAESIWVHGVLWALAALTLVLTMICHAGITSGLGRAYLWANALMTLQSGLFYMENYAFLAILGPRLVHDVTAFTFYVAHDLNRHGKTPQNWLYGAANKLHLGIFWVCPVIAVVLTFVIDRYTDDVANAITIPLLGHTVPRGGAFVLIGYLGMMHYFTEAFTWQKGSPYREHIALSS